TDIAGSALVPIAGCGFNTGVVLTGKNTTIGGTSPNARNLIAGHGLAGLNICGPQNVFLNILVQGNYIGADITGTKAFGNGIGVHLFEARGTTIGGATASARNLISGNGAQGVFIDIFLACQICVPCVAGVSRAPRLLPDFIVQGNYIGTDVSGTLPLGNGGD